MRCTRKAFVYTTSEAALARVKRTLSIAGVNLDKWKLPMLEKDAQCLVAGSECLQEKRVILESFEFGANINSELKEIAEWLSNNAFPQDESFNFFREKIRSDLVLLSDEDFGYFVRNATIVEPHVRISDASGTAEEGGLFYTENLPPETLLLSLAMASRDREDGSKLTADQVIATVLEGKSGDNLEMSGIDGRMIQIGGDATTGRGQVFTSAVNSMQT